MVRSGLLVLVLGGCSSAAAPAAAPDDQPVRPDAPVVAAQPGAWFDADGNLTVVGAGRRLRLQLSAPVIACAPGFQGGGSAAQTVERASLSFRVLADACRHDHPNILLPEESETASPAELERSYREVARCVAHDMGATSGWLPKLLRQSDPCPVSLGLGWRLPTSSELQGLGVDDRKAVAGALFDTEERTGFSSLLLYATDAGKQLTLSTLSPNAAEQAPALTPELEDKPFLGAALRCVRDAPLAAGARPPAPPLPNAAACIKQLRTDRGKLNASAPGTTLPEISKLKAWVETAQRTPTLLHNDASLRELVALLGAPALEQVAREARDERALTERYAQLAESLDDPQVSAAERDRRRVEFDGLRKRLSGQIVKSAPSSSADRGELSALLAHLLELVEGSTVTAKTAKKPGKARAADYAALLARLHELRGEKAKAP